MDIKKFNKIKQMRIIWLIAVHQEKKTKQGYELSFVAYYFSVASLPAFNWHCHLHQQMISCSWSAWKNNSASLKQNGTCFI